MEQGRYIMMASCSVMASRKAGRSRCESSDGCASAFGKARRPRGVHEEGEVLGVDRLRARPAPPALPHRRPRARAGRPGHRSGRAFVAEHDDISELRQPARPAVHGTSLRVPSRDSRSGRSARPGSAWWRGLLENVGDSRQSQAGVDRDQHGADAPSPRRRSRSLGRLSSHQRDLVAGPVRRGTAAPAWPGRHGSTWAKIHRRPRKHSASRSPQRRAASAGSAPSVARSPGSVEVPPGDGAKWPCCGRRSRPSCRRRACGCARPGPA